MKSILRRFRPSPAMVIACIALGVALGGTSVAAIQALPKNSVGPKQLKRNAVVSAKVKNRSLLAVDFKAGQLPAGPKGDKGDKGDPGAPGAPGAPGTAVAYAVITAGGSVDGSEGHPPKGITDAMITHPATGVYCFRNLPAGANVALASPDNRTNFDDTIASVFMSNVLINGCNVAAGDRVRVRTYDVSGVALTDRPFVIWFED